MSRFWMTVVVAVAAVAGAGVFLRGEVRVGVIVGVVWGFLIVLGLGVMCIRMGFFGEAECRGRVGRRVVALTFDDGPDPGTTMKLLELLKKEGVAGTFFCIGEKVERYPEIVRAMVAEGHEVGNHTQRHRWWSAMMLGAGWRREVRGAQEAILKAAGVKARFMRPPAGLTNPHLGGVLREEELRMVGWDVRTFDTRLSAEKVVERVRRKVRDGSVVLLHDGGVEVGEMLRVVEGVLGVVRGKGLGVRGLGEVLGDE